MSRLARAGRAAALAVPVALLVATAFADVLFDGRTLSAAAYVPGVLPSGPWGLRDWTRPARHVLDPEGAAWVDEPSPYLVARALAAGGVPLWNPDEGLGAPLAGNPNAAVWSPLALPVNLRPSPWMQDLVWLARVWLLGWFTALLARELGVGALAAAAAGTALALSGQTTLWIAHHPLNTDVFVPLALLGALRTLRGRRSGEALLAAAVAAGSLGGKPQSALVAALFGAVWLACATSWTAGVRPWLRLVRATVLGIGVAAVALVPFVETYAEASGLVRAGRTIQGAGTLPVAGLAWLAGPWAAALARAAGAAPPAEGAWLAPGLPYAGGVVLVLALAGALAQRRRALAWALAGTVLFYLLRVFAGWPAALGELPLLRSVSFVKYCFPLYLALALLAAFAIDAGGRWRALAAAALAAELVWLVPRPHPPRADPLAPAPYVEQLAALRAERGGRIGGPFDLLPPLVSNAAGFADLRAIDVLTPAATWNFVGRLVSPSRGLTWILTDLDPLLVATAPAADLADVRWILSRAPLDPAKLPAAVRAHVVARRTIRLFDRMRAYSIATPWLWAGVDAVGEDERFHWTCATPCRFALEMDALPRRMVAGVAAPAAARLETRWTVRADGAEGAVRAARAEEIAFAGERWHDVWLTLGSLSGQRGELVLEVTSATPAVVWIGGLGPSPGPAAEERERRRELRARRRELGELALRWADATAHVYENRGALGAAWMATRSVRSAAEERWWPRLAVAHDALAIATGGSAGIDWPGRSGGDARVVEAGDARLAVDVDAPSGGVLVVPQLARDWAAALDGRPTPIVEVDGALSGIVVPPGARRIELTYAPRSLRVGLVVSLASVVALGVVLRKARRRPART